MSATSESLESSSSEVFEEMEEEQATVMYATQMIESHHGGWMHIIEYKDIDSYDFSNNFIEIIKKPEYVHLYFDFDSIETMEQWNDVHEWLDSLVPVFGRYSVGGYTNNNEIGFEKMFKYIPNAHHTLSLHAVYYETKIKTNTVENEAVLALKVLGYTQQEIMEEINEIDTENMKVEENVYAKYSIHK